MGSYVLISMLNPMDLGNFLNISSSVVKGAWMKLPLLLPLYPFILKSLVCFIRSRNPCS